MNAPVFVVGPSACRADVASLSEQLAATVRDAAADVVICDVRAITRPDAGTIDVLARLQLTARRLGCGIRLYGAHPRLRGLLLLTGLSEVLPVLSVELVDPGRELSVELVEAGRELSVELVDAGRDLSVELVDAGREPEEREDAVDVQERVDPGDLVT